MKNQTLLLLLTVGSVAAWAQADPQQQDRARIVEERRQIEQRHEQALRVCVGRFAVTACQDEARAERRSALAVLRARELQLDDAERARRAELRRAAIGEKERQAARRAASAPEIRTRAPRPPLAPSAAASSPAPGAHERTPIDGGAAAAAARVEQARQRQDEMRQRQAAIEARRDQQAQRAKARPQAAAPLPAPAGASHP